MNQKDRKDELSTTSGVPAVNTPVGVSAKGRKKKDKKTVEVWEDQKIVELKKTILDNLHRIKTMNEISPENYTSQDNFMSACVRKEKEEGTSAEKAVEVCNGMWYDNKE